MDSAYFLQTTNLNMLFFKLFCNNRLPITPNDIGGLPRGVVAPLSRRMIVIVAAIEITAVVFFVWNQRVGMFPFGMKHAAILASCVLFSYIFFRSMYGSGEPPVPWDQYYNNRITTILSLCERHGYQIDTPSKATDLAKANAIHFDEDDYGKLAVLWGKTVRDINAQIPLPQRSDGTVDYDRACAAEIVSLSDAIPGTMEQVSRDFDLTNVDRNGLDHIASLATALKQQWSNRLYER